MSQSHHDAGFVVLQIATAQIEGIEQYRRGKSSRNRSQGFFCDGLKRIFSLTAKDDTWLCEFYDLCRCGLLHDGMTRGRVIIENDFPLPLEYKDNCILVSVQMVTPLF